MTAAAAPASSDAPLFDEFEGVAFTVNGRELVGRCLDLKDGMRFLRLLTVIDRDAAKAPDENYLNALEELVTTFPAAIGHANLRMTLKECVTVARVFLYRLRGVPEPKAPTPTGEPSPSAPTPAPA